MSIRELRGLLKSAIGFEVRKEKERLMQLNVSIRRECRLKGAIVEVPPLGFYTKREHQLIGVTTIADWIESKPQTSAP